MVDHTSIFLFRLLWFVNNGLAAGMGLDSGWQQRYARFCGRVAVLSIVSLLLYPFHWGWTVIGTFWYAKAKNCIPEGSEPSNKYFVLIWILCNYLGLCGIAIYSFGKWLERRQALMARAQQGIPISAFGVLVDMISVPGWAFEAAEQVRGMGQVAAAAYHPGCDLTPAQREALETLIQELPKFRLKSVPTDCSECPICLDEFVVGDEVRGLPCAHNFHVECIDQWLRLNVKCPQCRSSAFPNLDSGLTNLQPELATERSTSTVVNATQHATAQTLTQDYQLRLQGLLRPVQSVNGGSGNEHESSLETAGNGNPTTNPVPEHIVDIIS